MGKPCNCKMKRCSIEEKKRETIHEQYWNMNRHEQKMWLASYCRFNSPKRRYSVANENETKRRKVTRQLFLPVSGKEISVCQKMFLSTLGFATDKPLETLQKSKNEVGVVARDQRGLHPPKHKLTDVDLSHVIAHIKKYKPCISHYRREHFPHRLFLPSELDIVEMHQDFVNECEETGRRSVSYLSYWRQVKIMKISFSNLGCEECEICDEYLIHIAEKTKENVDSGDVVRKKSRKAISGELTSTEKGEEAENTPPDATATSKDVSSQVKSCSDDCTICSKYKIHKELYALSLKKYDEDKERSLTDKSIIFLSADLQKVILLPRLPGYKVCLFTSRLITFNMTFAPLGKKGVHHEFNPVGILWHEEIAGRKDENISSAFYKIIQHHQFRDSSDWVLWTDNCGASVGHFLLCSFRWSTVLTTTYSPLQ